MFYKPAKAIAVEICYKLQPYCDRINIAGSLRRKKPEVKDIEIIAQPKITPIKDLFENIIGSHRSPEFISLVNNLGRIIKGKAADGKMMQIELKERIILDLFMPDDFDYYRQYVVRTGPRDYSNYVIAAGWRKKGFCGSDLGLRKMEDCIETKLPDGKSKWRCINTKGELPPVWSDEKNFYSWLGIPYLEPEKRI